MMKSWILISMLLTLLASEILSQYSSEGQQNRLDSDDMDYYGVILSNLLASNRQIIPEKRSCIRRTGPCDHRPNDCCPKSACRCNLWGTNCRCSRLGLFQKWGKKR